MVKDVCLYTGYAKEVLRTRNVTLDFGRQLTLIWTPWNFFLFFRHVPCLFSGVPLNLKISRVPSSTPLNWDLQKFRDVWLREICEKYEGICEKWKTWRNMRIYQYERDFFLPIAREYEEIRVKYDEVCEKCVENMKEYEEIWRKMWLWDLERYESLYKLFLLNKGSGTWKNSELHPLYRSWNLEKRMRIVVYCFLPM